MSDKTDSIEELLARPALRLKPAFWVLDVADTTGREWIKKAVLDRLYVEGIPYVTTESIKRALRADE